MNETKQILDPIQVPQEMEAQAPEMLGVAQSINEKHWWDFKWLPTIGTLMSEKNKEVLPLGQKLLNFWKTGEPDTLVNDIERSYLKSGDVEIAGSTRHGAQYETLSSHALWNRISEAVKKLTSNPEKQSESRKASVKFLREGAEKTKGEIKWQKAVGYSFFAAIPLIPLAVAGATTTGVIFSGLFSIGAILGGYNIYQYMKRKSWLTKATELTADMIDKSSK